MNTIRMMALCAVALLAACGKVTTTKPDGGTSTTDGGSGGGTGGGAGGGSGGGGGSTAKCGDGLKAATEACDDGNKMADDGCSATCTVETGWTCTGATKSTCVLANCGNGKVDAAEQCDDGNTTPGDGCSATCKAEPGWEVEPNEDDATANDFTVVSLNQKVQGSINPATDLDVYKVEVPAGTTGTFNIVTLDAAGKSCLDKVIDTTLTIRDSKGDAVDSDTDSGPGYCSRIVITNPVPGTYFVEVSGDSAADPDVFSYALAIGQAVCGDGTVTAPTEGCDDGNTTGGDGCDSTCSIESGYGCTGTAPSTCTKSCGNSTIDGTDACDDGNTKSLDGCSSSCRVETGYTCTGSPSVCTKSCGNGKIDGAETCDDANTSSGDGCSSYCKVETDYACSGTPSVCTSACATATAVTLPTGATPTTVNGSFPVGKKVQYYKFTLAQTAYVSIQALNGTGGSCDAATPALDIDLSVLEDDCSTSVDYEYANGCPPMDLPSLPAGTYIVRASLFVTSTQAAAVPFQLQISLITPGCGNSRKETGETCDDGNKTPGDGCDANCATESGWVCTGGTGSASSCHQLVCGDGKKEGLEECDDANVTNGDGCSSTCIKEAGWLCSGGISSPTTCTKVVCGDGKAQGTEDCDDANTNNGDGCSSACAEETGWTCTGGYSTPSSCHQVICGDGKKEGAEDCDDSNTANGDGCSNTCMVEPGYSCTGYTTSTCTMTCGNGKRDTGEDCDDGNTTGGDGCDKLCNREPGYTCTLSYSASSTCAVTCGNGALDTTKGESCDDGNLTAGDGCSPFCTIESPVEVEPNDTTANAQALTFTGNVAMVLGNHPVADVDVYAVTVPAGKGLFIEVMEGDGTETCESNGIDSYLRLKDAAGVTVTTDDDGRGYCSQIDPASSHTSAANLAAGTYYVEVTQSPSSFGTNGSTFKYVLRVEKK